MTLLRTGDAAEAVKDCERRTLMAIVQQPVSFEGSAAQQLSAAARSVIERLLEKDPALRLGSRRGAGELKRHPFFEPVHWALLAHSKPPLVLAATAATTTASVAASGSSGTGSAAVDVDAVALAELQSAVHKSWTWDAFDDTDTTATTAANCSQDAALSSSSAVTHASSSSGRQHCSDSRSSSDSIGMNSQARHTSDGFAAYDFCADDVEISHAGPDSTAV
jgi:serine/threonine protein kinase